MKDFDFVFNPEEIKRKKKYNDPSINLFYIDEIQDKLRNLTTDNLKKRKDIINKQNWTLKNMTYFGSDIPSRWKLNNKYNKNVVNMIKKDKQFVDYLMNTEAKSDISTQDSKKSFFADIVEEKRIKNPNVKRKKTKYEALPSLITKENKEPTISPINENKDLNIETAKHKTVSFNATANYFKAKIDTPHLSSNNLEPSMKNTHLQFNHKASFLFPIKPTMRDFNKTSSKILSFEKDLIDLTKNKIVKKEKEEEVVLEKDKERTTFFNSTFNYYSKKSHSTLNNFFKRNHKNESEIKVGNLLNVDYDGLFKKKINIHNNELKSKWHKVDHYGPKYAHCNTCFNKNLEFFDKINPKDGINIINFIETTKNFYDLNN